ncbi:MAG TPA: chemotaxis protein CheW, partial [Halobacteria archaeon]|nr:chemotaxis protein CheW [Halobacteria archaeon]
PAGILVDDVRDVKYISDEEIDKVPSIISKSKGGKFLTGVGKIKDDLILLVDLDKIFSLEDLNI